MNRRTFGTLTTLSFAAGAARLTRAERSPGPRIKIGQIGTRHAHAGGQLAALRRCPDFEVIGVVEADEEQRRRVERSADFAGLRWMSEEELLNTPGLAAVAVETEVGALLRHAERVVDAGLHLHLDKPAGESLAHFRRILETATRKNRLVKMGYMFRFNPAFQLCVEAVRQGWLGTVFSVRGEMSKAISAGERAKLAPYRGGSMFELGCHLIDAIVWMLGRPDRVASFPRSLAGDGFPDNMLAVLEYERAAATVRSSLMEPDGGARRQLIVCGDRGSVEIRPLEPPGMRLMLDAPRGSYVKGTQEVKLEPAPRYLGDWGAFARAIRGETDWAWPMSHDLAVQETVLRASGLA